MGDLRADIKIQMSLWGHKYKQEFWINYWDDGDGNDERVKKWFRECYQDAYGKYQEEMQEIYAERHKADEEKAERSELERLKAKYEAKQ